MNLLSVGAAYGLLVLVTQEGHGTGLLRLPGRAHGRSLDSVVPVLGALRPLHGLPGFPAPRIRERYDQRGDTREAVAYGISSTARLITGAALIMVVVFAGFATGQLVMFQQMGFGLGVAMLIDATLVRSSLCRPWMELLGDRNWYLPSSSTGSPTSASNRHPRQPPRPDGAASPVIDNQRRAARPATPTAGRRRTLSSCTSRPVNQARGC